jgi:hypothetical protein
MEAMGGEETGTYRLLFKSFCSRRAGAEVTSVFTTKNGNNISVSYSNMVNRAHKRNNKSSRYKYEGLMGDNSHTYAPLAT